VMGCWPGSFHGVYTQGDICLACRSPMQFARDRSAR
jgi:hypothetical protein